MSRIKYKLTLAFIFTTLTISVLYGLLIFKAMEYTEDDILNRRLNLEFRDYVQQLEQHGEARAVLPKSTGLNSYLSSSPDLPVWLKQQTLGSRELHDREVHVGVFDLPDKGKRLYLVLDELAISNLENDLSLLVIVLISLAVGISFLGLIIGLFFSRQIAKPIQLLTEDVNHSQVLQKEVFFGHQRNDEIGALSRAFSSLVGRLEAFISRERKFTEYVSHEFRTPISLMKNAVAVLQLPEQSKQRQQRNLLRIESATQEMENLINTFLNLSREKTDLVKQDIDIVSLLHSLLERNQSIYDNQRLAITVRFDAPLQVNSDKQILSILIDNVIRNMFIHADAKATITLSGNTLTFSNDMKAHDPQARHRGNSQGLDIIHQLAEKLGMTTSTSVVEQQYQFTLNF